MIRYQAKYQAQAYNKSAKNNPKDRYQDHWPYESYSRDVKYYEEYREYEREGYYGQQEAAQSC